MTAAPVPAPAVPPFGPAPDAFPPSTDATAEAAPPAAVPVPAAPAPRTEPYGPPVPPPRVFSGELRCQPLAGVTEGELRTPIRIVLQGNALSYRREVRMPQGFGRGSERGAGILGEDGVIRMEGEAEGRGWSYRTRFAGRMVQREIGLLVRQDWTFGEEDERARGCTVSATAPR